MKDDDRLIHLAIAEWRRIQDRLAKIEKLLAEREQESKQ